jgi:hypothetical protein
VREQTCQVPFQTKMHEMTSRIFFVQLCLRRFSFIGRFQHLRRSRDNDCPDFVKRLLLSKVYCIIRGIHRYVLCAPFRLTRAIKADMASL